MSIYFKRLIIAQHPPNEIEQKALKVVLIYYSSLPGVFFLYEKQCSLAIFLKETIRSPRCAISN